MSGKRRAAGQPQQAIVLVGTIMNGFEFFGPYPVPLKEKDEAALRTAVVLARGHFGRNDPPFMIVPLSSPDDKKATVGNCFTLFGSLSHGFKACGPFGDETAARRFARKTSVSGVFNRATDWCIVETKK